MMNYGEFKDKLRQGRLCLGTCITFNDPTVTEAFSACSTSSGSTWSITR